MALKKLKKVVPTKEVEEVAEVEELEDEELIEEEETPKAKKAAPKKAVKKAAPVEEEIEDEEEEVEEEDELEEEVESEEEEEVEEDTSDDEDDDEEEEEVEEEEAPAPKKAAKKAPAKKSAPAPKKAAKAAAPAKKSAKKTVDPDQAITVDGISEEVGDFGSFISKDNMVRLTKKVTAKRMPDYDEASVKAIATVAYDVVSEVFTAARLHGPFKFGDLHFAQRFISGRNFSTIGDGNVEMVDRISTKVDKVIIDLNTEDLTASQKAALAEGRKAYDAKHGKKAAPAKAAKKVAKKK
jgi:chemotaxis protein histidine kinase CheA